MLFSICWDVVLPVSFHSLSMLSSSLSIFKVFASNSNVCISCGIVLFLSSFLWMGHSFLFLHMLCNFLFKITFWISLWTKRKQKKKRLSESLQIGFVLGPFVNTSLPASTELRLFIGWASQLWKLVIFSEHASCSELVCGFLDSSVYAEAFQCPYSPKFLTPSFSSLTFSISFVCLNYYILPQAIAFVLWSFNFSKECSALSHSHFPMLREFWVR